MTWRTVLIAALWFGVFAALPAVLLWVERWGWRR